MQNSAIKENYIFNADNKTIKSHSESDNISLLKTTSQTDNLKVVIRVRPALSREMENDIPFRSIGLISNDNKSCSLVEYLGAELYEKERQREWMENPNLFQIHRFTFDHAFDMDASQQEVYEVTAKPAVLSILEGYNSTIFAYGQTGTGKTYTMEGFTYNSSDTQRGIIPRSIEEIFNHIESFSSPDTKFMVRASYLQIYNESISDLLKPEKISLQIREDKKKGVFVEGLSEWAVRNPADIYTLLQRGAASRTTASTKMNDVSSRSHAVFMIVVEQLTILESGNEESVTQIKVGKLNLVDLAGSERIRVTGATGRQLEESKKINKSLSALGNVIYALTDNKGRTHIPYRDSKLTRLLEDSLGGNCKTTMMAMISPCHDSFNESLSTLHFSKRAKNIKNRPIINEDVDHKALIRQYEVELKKLRNELEEKNRLIHTNELVIQLEEERKRAEEDKQAALYAFEQASKQYLQEREEKKRLEMKIQMMNSQVIIGGHKIEDTPQFRSALEERQTILLKEFDQKLQEFDKEKQQIEEDKAQVEHYKKFLQKLRDIMIALTTRLNERNETIDQLHEEIEAYEKIIRDLEDGIDIKIHRINILEDLLKKNNIDIPLNTMPQIEKEKNYGRRTFDKLYIPYDYDRGDRGLEGAPITMLNADEKIRELNSIIKEQDKELNIMKIVVQKFMNNQNEKVNLNEMYLKYENEYESQNKIRELEEYRYKLLKEIDEKDEIINFNKQENEEFNEQIDFLDQNFGILNNEYNKINSIQEEVLKSLNSVFIKLNSIEQIGSQQQTMKNIKSEIGIIIENIKKKQFLNSHQISSSNSNNNNENNTYNNMHRNGNNFGAMEENTIINPSSNKSNYSENDKQETNLIKQINNNYNNFKEKRNRSMNRLHPDTSANKNLEKSATNLNILISSENLKNTNNILKAYRFENINNEQNTPGKNNSGNNMTLNSNQINQTNNIKPYPNSSSNSNNTSFIYQNANLNLNNINNNPININPSPGGLKGSIEKKKSFNSPPQNLNINRAPSYPNLPGNYTTNFSINNNGINNSNPIPLSYYIPRDKDKVMPNTNYNTYSSNSNKIPSNTGNIAIKSINQTNNSQNNNMNVVQVGSSSVNNNRNNPYGPVNYNFNNNFINIHPTNVTNLNNNVTKINRLESNGNLNSNSKQDNNNNNNNNHNNHNINPSNYNNTYFKQIQFLDVNNSSKLKNNSKENSQDSNFNMSSPNLSDKNKNLNINYQYNNTNRPISDLNNNYNGYNRNIGNINEYTLGCNDDLNTNSNNYNTYNNDSSFNNPPINKNNDAKNKSFKNKSESFVNKFINTNK